MTLKTWTQTTRLSGRRNDIRSQQSQSSEQKNPARPNLNVFFLLIFINSTFVVAVIIIIADTFAKASRNLFFIRLGTVAVMTAIGDNQNTMSDNQTFGKQHLQIPSFVHELVSRNLNSNTISTTLKFIKLPFNPLNNFLMGDFWNCYWDLRNCISKFPLMIENPSTKPFCSGKSFGDNLIKITCWLWELWTFTVRRKVRMEIQSAFNCEIWLFFVTLLSLKEKKIVVNWHED